MKSLVERSVARGDGNGKQTPSVDGVELIRTIAEIAAHFDDALVRQDTAYFILSERLQHTGDAFVRARAAEKDRLRFEHANVILIEEPAQDLPVGQRAQFFALQRIADQLHT